MGAENRVGEEVVQAKEQNCATHLWPLLVMAMVPERHALTVAYY